MKVVLITGASSGIGNLLARKAVAENYTVIINARRSEALNEIKLLAPERVITVIGDVTDKNVQTKLIEEVDRIGHLDYLFNNAGFGYYGQVEKQDNIAAVIDLNVTTLIEITRKCIPYLKTAAGGRIINVASVLGRIEIPFMSVYIATKYAVVGFTKALNLELANTTITATAMCPSGVRTEFSKVSGGGEYGRQTDQFAEEAEKVVNGIWKKKDLRVDVAYPTRIAWFTVFITKLLRPFIISVMKNMVRKKGDKLF